MRSTTKQKIGSSGVVPPALLDESKIPKFYHDAIVLCGALTANQFPDTGLVYNLIVTSQLPRDLLGNIWSLVNRTLPGRLTRQEFYSCLALIALAQKGESLSALCDVSSLPIPFFQSFTVNPSLPANEKLKINKFKKTKKVFESSLPQFFTHLTTIKNPKLTKSDFLVDFDSMIAANSNGNFNPIFEPNYLTNHEKVSENCLQECFESNSCNEDDESLSSISNEASTSEFQKTKNENTTKFYNPLFDVMDQKKILTHITVWRSCLNEAIIVFTDTFDLVFNNNKHFNDIFETERGIIFLSSLVAMHFVIQRILTSIKILLATIKNCSTPKKYVMCNDENFTSEIVENMESLLLQCNLAEEKWNNLQEFFPINFQENNLQKTSIYRYSTNNIFYKPNLKCLLCNICIQPVNENESTRIHFLGYSYHSKCANFYLNRVGALLPQLISL